MKRIFLIGYMGSGKSTIGCELAHKLGLAFVDLDNYIETRYQKTIGQLFESQGEDKFREIESNMLREVADFENVVISTGGGTPCFFDNMDYMNRMGQTVYLKGSARILTERLDVAKDKRPLIKDKNKEELYNFVERNIVIREPFYNLAKVIFETENLTRKEEIEKYVEQLMQRL